MWKPDQALRRTTDAGTRRDSRNMAIRRRMVRGKVTFAVLGITVLVLMMGGSVFVSNQVTALRSDIARLQDRQDYLESGSALLLTDWNRETCAEVLVPRAKKKGFILPARPDLVLLEVDPGDGEKAGVIRRFIGRLGGADQANAAELPPALNAETMVSLHPRRAGAERAATQ